MDAADPQLARDRERLETVRRKRSEQAADYFARNAGAWGELRSLHVEESRVEAAMLDLAGKKADPVYARPWHRHGPAA